MDEKYDYDYAVIGGGSGGLSSAKTAADLGASVVLFDYVKPSPQGTTWGLGGTCVNVGCIPKKLMHYTALLGAGMHDAKKLGWEFKEPEHKWSTMVESVTNYIRSLNFGYRSEMVKRGVKYLNALAKFKDAHTITYTDSSGKEMTCTAKYILIATGGRPYFPDCPGMQELAISSDDIFWKADDPGKVLCIGASYISLECAGFLNECGYDTTVMVRSILLRGFDRECADRIGEFMEHTGCKFIKEHVPERLDKTDDGRIQVTYKASKGAGNPQKEVFDTVLVATGRYADVEGLNLAAAGVKTTKKGKFDVVDEQTNVPHIYAVGDVVEGQPELTPVAIQAGMLLAKRLFGGSKMKMDYVNVPTTVFTPVEYSCCGYSEEDAKAKFGDFDIEVYHTLFTPLEMAATHRESHLTKDDLPNFSSCKLICLKSDAERVVGIHYVGPNAGEVMQGFGLAIKLGATKADFDNVVGIHPTTAENFTTLKITKSSGEDADAGGC